MTVYLKGKGTELAESLTAFCNVWYHLEMILAPCSRLLALRFAVEELGRKPLSWWPAWPQIERFALDPIEHQRISGKLELDNW
jgi:hypothetical protein